MLVNHHVGKRSEDGQAPERVYRGRGASASGGAARAVWLLIPDPTTPGLSTLSCVKAKGDPPPEVRLKLDTATRWLTPQILEAQPVVNLVDKVITVIKGWTKTSEIKAAFKPTYSDRAIEEAISEAFREGKIQLIKKVFTLQIPHPQKPQKPQKTKKGMMRMMRITVNVRLNPSNRTTRRLL